MPPVKPDPLHLIELIKNLPKGANGVPLKKSFNPLALPLFIPHYVLAKVPSFGSMIVLLSGERVDTDYGAILKGVDIFDIISPREKKIFPNIHKILFDHPCGLFTRQKLEKRSGLIQPTATYTFPLTSDEGDAKYLLMFFENQESKNLELSKTDQFSRFSSYSELDYIDIGNGVPDIDKYTAKLIIPHQNQQQKSNTL